MIEADPTERIPEHLRSRFAVLSKLDLIRGLLCIFAVCGVVWGLLVMLVGSFVGPTALVAGILDFLTGACCLCLAIATASSICDNLRNLWMASRGRDFVLRCFVLFASFVVPSFSATSAFSAFRFQSLWARSIVWFLPMTGRPSIDFCSRRGISTPIPVGSTHRLAGAINATPDVTSPRAGSAGRCWL